MTEFIDLLRTLFAEHAQTLLFANVLLEQLGVPIPAYPTMIVAGTVAGASSGGTLATVFALAVLACLIADTVWYYAGRRYGSALMRGICRVSLSQDRCIRKSTDLYRQVGPRMLLVAKFLPGAGALSTLMAGTSGTALPVFLLYDLAGSAIWVGSALMLGLIFQDAVGAMLALLTTYALPGLLIVVALFATYLACKYLQRRKLLRHSRQVPRLPLDELGQLMTDGRPVVLLDVRARDEQGGDAIIPGAIAMPIDSKAALLAALPRDTAVIVYCDCPDEISAAYLAARIRALGHPEVYALRGGYQGWRQACPLGAQVADARQPAGAVAPLTP